MFDTDAVRCPFDFDAAVTECMAKTLHSSLALYQNPMYRHPTQVPLPAIMIELLDNSLLELKRSLVAHRAALANISHAMSEFKGDQAEDVTKHIHRMSIVAGEAVESLEWEQRVLIHCKGVVLKASGATPCNQLH